KGRRRNSKKEEEPSEEWFEEEASEGDGISNRQDLTSFEPPLTGSRSGNLGFGVLPCCFNAFPKA
ncbi:MAG: hypothetical protein J0M24_21675, partial [Verrucomicrobia bacterium]|nr:hypothetical protein [Verrucomicrobiota bacterium]